MIEWRKMTTDEMKDYIQELESHIGRDAIEIARLTETNKKLKALVLEKERHLSPKGEDDGVL